MNLTNLNKLFILIVFEKKPLSSRGLGPLFFTEETGIRIPPGVIDYKILFKSQKG